MKLNKSKCCILHLGWSNTGLKYKWEEDAEREVWISSSSDPVTGHGNDSKLLQEEFRLNIRKRFCTERAVKHWNRIPSEMVDAPSLSLFKKHLDNALNNML